MAKPDNPIFVQGIRFAHAKLVGAIDDFIRNINFGGNPEGRAEVVLSVKGRLPTVEQIIAEAASERRE